MTAGIAAGFTAPVEESRTQAVAWALAPVAVAVGSLTFGMVAIGHRSVSTDEAASLADAGGSLGSVLSTILHDDPGQAGNLLVLKLASIVGSDERAIRAPAAVAVAVAAGLLVVLGTMLLGRLEGVVAGVAMAVNAGVIEASRVARPYALGMLGIVVVTLLFLFALERGGGWRWVAYAAAGAALPLTHPLAASVLAAHGATLLARRDRTGARRAGVALLAGTGAAGLLLTWMAADRFDTPSGTGGLGATEFGHGLARAIGWNPVLVAAAVAGIAILFRTRANGAGSWRVVLVSGLVLAPAAATLLAAIALPLHAGALVLCAPGIALAVGPVARALSPVRGLVWAGLALLLVGSVTALTVRFSTGPDQDWRALARAVARVRGVHETAVVVPERSRAAFAYYAPYVPLTARARGDGAWVAVVASTPAAAAAAARPVVSTPRYALLRQFRYGDELRLQHWVRP